MINLPCLPSIKTFPKTQDFQFLKLRQLQTKPFQFSWKWGGGGVSIYVETFILTPRESWGHRDEFVTLMGVEVVDE